VKPSDLKPLFPREAPRLVYQNQFLAVPRGLIAPENMPTWEEIFPRQQPLYVEYCSGNGHWITQQAMLHPQINWIAIELQFERARKIWSKKENLKLDNLLIICGEGREVTETYLPKGYIERFFVHFPDPWPKRRHAKHRIMQENFLEHVAHAGAAAAEFIFVTDALPYMEESVQLLSRMSLWKPLLPSPYFIQTTEYGYSTFAQLWKELGRQFHFTRFEKQ